VRLYAIHLFHNFTIVTTLQNSSQLSPNSASLRVSQPNSFSSSPIMTHKLDNYAADNSEAQQQASFIKPLPCTNDRSVLYSSTDAKMKPERSNPQDDIPPIVLDPPPQGRRTDNKALKKTSPVSSATNQGMPDNKSSMQNSRNLATILRTSGPPPSRTTSARLPSRNDLMSEMQRTTWARHTTK